MIVAAAFVPTKTFMDRVTEWDVNAYDAEGDLVTTVARAHRTPKGISVVGIDGWTQDFADEQAAARSYTKEPFVIFNTSLN